MAIYHLNVSTGSKSQGKSAKAKAQYITRTGRYSRGKAEVLYSFSGNMPSWAASQPMEYWQATDTHERNNGVLFREVEFALPVELNQQQRIELAKEFCQKIAGSELPFTMAAHRGKEHNPHCHFLLSERLNDGHCRTPETWFKRAASAEKTPESGGARKADIGSKRKIWLAEIREQWAALANVALKRAGHEVRIDHQSLKDQGVDDRLPQIHMGTAAVEMEEKGIETDRADRALFISLVNVQFDELKKIESEILHEQRTRSRETSTQPAGRNSRAATAGTRADSRNRSTSRPTGQHGESLQAPPTPTQPAKTKISRPSTGTVSPPTPKGGCNMELQQQAVIDNIEEANLEDLNRWIDDMRGTMRGHAHYVCLFAADFSSARLTLKQHYECINRLRDEHVVPIRKMLNIHGSIQKALDVIEGRRDLWENEWIPQILVPFQKELKATFDKVCKTVVLLTPDAEHEQQEFLRVRRLLAAQQQAATEARQRQLSEEQKLRFLELEAIAEEAKHTRKDQRLLDHYFAWGCMDELRQRKQTVETADWKETESKVASKLLANGANVADVAYLVFDLGLSATIGSPLPANALEHLKNLACNRPDLADAMRVAERREQEEKQQNRQADEDGEKTHSKQSFPQLPGV